MTKVLVSLKVKPAFAPAKAGPFLHNHEYGCLLYGGKPLTVEEFNRDSEVILNANVSYGKIVRIIEEESSDKPFIDLVESRKPHESEVQADAQTETEGPPLSGNAAGNSVPLHEVSESESLPEVSPEKLAEIKKTLRKRKS